MHLFFPQDVSAKNIAEKVHNLAADDLRIALVSAAHLPDATASVLADLTEISYTFLSNRALTVISSSETAGAYALIVSALTITASGGTAAAFQGAVLYNNTPTNPNKPLIARCDLGTTYTLKDGESLTITFDPNGIIRIGQQSFANMQLSAHSSGRYLVDVDGIPVRLHGDAAWIAANELTLADWQYYLDDRRARGINCLIMQATNPVKYVASSIAPAMRSQSSALPFTKNTSGTTWDGDPTFSHFDAAFDFPNDTYFDGLDIFIHEAALRGMYIIIDPMYMGYNNGAQDGWWQTLTNAYNTQTICNGFGSYLGARWKKHPNLILDIGTDMFPAAASEGAHRMQKLFDGLISAGCTQLISAHFARSSDARDDSDFTSYVNFNSVYPGGGAAQSYIPTHGRCRHAYAKTSAMPCAPVEMNYEGEGTYTRVQIRSNHWWGALSAIGGAAYGNGVIWPFDTAWKSHLDDIGMRDFKLLNDFLAALPWNELVPDGLGTIGTLVTAGGGSSQTIAGTPGNVDTADGFDFVAAAANPSGSTLVAYVPDAHTGSVTIDMTKLRGTATCDWYDPTNGASTAIGSIANTGTHAFTTPGNNASGTADWVLRILA